MSQQPQKRRRWQHISTGKRIASIVLAVALLVASAQQPISFIPVLIGVLFAIAYLAMPDDTQRFTSQAPADQPSPPAWSQRSAGTPPPLPWESAKEHQGSD